MDTAARKKKLGELIRAGEIGLGGNSRDRIYGLLTCAAGKRMGLAKRVFFKDESEAVSMGYRPCGSCMRGRYKLWKAAQRTRGISQGTGFNAS